MRLIATSSVAVALAVFAAGCGQTSMQRAGTGAGVGAIAGGLIGGPIGALAGAGVGAAGGLSRDTIEERTDAAVGEGINVAQRQIDQMGQEGRPASPAMQREQTAMGDGGPSDRDRMRSRSSGPRLTNEQVREAQVALADLGLYEGQIDGLYGWRSIGAVRQFQERHDMPKTGMLTTGVQQEIQQVAMNNPSQRRGAAGGTTGEATSPREQTIPRMDESRGQSGSQTKLGADANPIAVERADVPQSGAEEQNTTSNEQRRSQ